MLILILYVNYFQVKQRGTVEQKMNSFNKSKIFSIFKKVSERELGDYNYIQRMDPIFKHTRRTLISLIVPIWESWTSSMNSIISLELEGPMSLKMSSSKTFNPDDLQRLQGTIESSKQTNPFYTIESEMRNILPSLPDKLTSGKSGSTFPTETFIRLFWQELLMHWHEEFLQLLIKDLDKKFTQKMLLEKGFHNLSQMEVPQHLIEILKKGEKYSPHLPLPINTYQRQFQGFVWNFIKWSARTLCKSDIATHKDENDLDETLKELTIDENDPFHSFWESIKYHYYTFKSQICVTSQFQGRETAGTGMAKDLEEINLPSQILQAGLICTTADKHYGLVLLPLEAVRQAEVKILHDLGGIEIHGGTALQILDKLNLEESDLRTSTSHMSNYLRAFPTIPRSKQKMAFLKLNPKIHKLSLEDITKKKLDSLTFRPICDSEFYTTKPCAQALASLLLSLKEKVLCLYPNMRGFYPQSGTDVARQMRLKKFPTNEPFNLIVSCDLTDAYSNATLEDLVNCSQFLSAVVKNDTLEQEMIEELANFALNNNYIESGGKIYKCKPVLPMGSCLSGEALDIILMAGELRLLINPALEKDVLQTIPTYLDASNMGIKFLDYERFRDDTKILVSAARPQDIILSLTTFAKAAFPQRIPISFEYSNFMQSFLNCCFFCNFAGRSFSTYPRLNFKRPSKVVHPSSNTWKPYLFSGYVANMVDCSRICTEPSIQRFIYKLLQKELEAAGHGRGNINIYRKKAYLAIESAQQRDRLKYEKVHEDPSNLLHENPTNDQDDEELDAHHPPGVIYDSNSNVFKLAKLLVTNSSNMIAAEIRSPSAKNSPHLKALLASTNRYKSQSQYL